MIRKLRELDLASVQKFLQEEMYQNLYMLGNLQTLGLEREYCQFWVDYEESLDSPASLRAVLNRYMSGWALYGRDSADWPGLARIVDEHPLPKLRLQDNPGGVTSFLPYLRCYAIDRVKEEELMVLRERNFSPVSPATGYVVRRATQDDLSRLCRFYSDAGDMSRTPAAVERPLRDTRVWIAEEGEEIVSAALTNAETAEAAMVGGVFTLPHWRGYGISQMLCSALCHELLQSGREPVLYWYTAAAGAVYRKLGFRRTGTWRSAWLTRTPSES